MTKTAARELAPAGIRVNSVYPGVIDTDMLEETPLERLAELADATPMGRVGQPDDIAGPVVFLLSDEAGYMTGAELTVDGGTIA
jgi:NAD(P)-dependent dehydrogenase (short-subunit alcohol dehydrogenase family)